MKQILTALCVALLGAALFGCAALPKGGREGAAAAQEQLSALLLAFEQAIVRKEPQRIRPLIAQRTLPSERRRLLQAAGRACRLQWYRGYRLDAQAAAANVASRAARKGQARMRVEATNSAGERFKDKFAVVREDGGWALRQFELREPLFGEALDLPDEDEDHIRRKLNLLLERLRSRDITSIFYSLPDDPTARVRPYKGGFWSRLFGSRGGVRIFDDLETVARFHITGWPGPDDELALGYVSDHQVMAIYDLSYVWPEGGIVKDDALRVEVMLAEREDEWDYQLLRFYAKGLPGTQ